MPSGKSKKTHSKGRKTKLHKRGVRKIFSARHIDQVSGGLLCLGSQGSASSCLLFTTLHPDCCHTAVFVALPESQVWEDVRKAEGVHDGKVGPLGTTDK